VAAAPPARGCEAFAERASLERGGSGPPLAPRSAADESASQWHYRTHKGVFGPFSLAQLRAWRPGLEQRGVFVSLRVWCAGEDEVTHAVLLADVLDAVQEREAAPAPAVADEVTGDGGGKTEKSRYTGVRYHNGSKGWQAQLRIPGKDVSLGMFNSQQEAAKQIDRCALA
jgi:hypothetical protein